MAFSPTVQTTVGQEAVIAFTGATIETVGKSGRIENGIVIVRGDKIQSVGTDVEIPDTARIVDIPGCTIMPGVIDPYYAIRISSSEPQQTTRTIVVRGRTITLPSFRSVSTSFARIEENFYPYDIDFRPLLRSGITILNLTARGNGQAALARNTPDQSDSMIVNGDGVLFASVTNDTATLDVLRNGLRGGRGGRSSARGKSTSVPGSSRGRSSSRMSQATVKLWQEVRDGERPLVINANNSAAILHLFEVLKPFKNVRLALISTGSNVYQTMDELKKRKLTLILGPSIDTAPNTNDRICAPREVHKAGIPFAFSLALSQGDLTASQDAPLFRVAYMVKAGLPRDAALIALTTRPAELLGIEKTHGSIEPQKAANLLVFSGDPLDPGSQLRQVMVEGSVVYEN